MAMPATTHIAQRASPSASIPAYVMARNCISRSSVVVATAWRRVGFTRSWYRSKSPTVVLADTILSPSCRRAATHQVASQVQGTAEMARTNLGLGLAVGRGPQPARCRIFLPVSLSPWRSTTQSASATPAAVGLGMKARSPSRCASQR